MLLIDSKFQLLVTASLLAVQPLFASEGEGETKPFADETLTAWQEKSFVGNTDYTLVVDQGTKVLKASANKTASVLYKEQAIDLTMTPWLEWSWKIESTYNDIDETTREGDDFPARLYVTAQTGLLPWETIAINYVWSSNQPLNTAWQSPFTDKSMMVAVQSGNQLAEHWTSQRRNVADDFKQFFNVDVKKLSGYAVMVDGDNASQVGTAYFGGIVFENN